MLDSQLTMDKINCAFFMDSFGQGGAEKALEKILNANIWQKNNINVHLVLNQRAKKQELTFSKENQFKNHVNIHYLPINLSLKNPFRSFLEIHKICKKLGLDYAFSLMMGMSRNLLWFKKIFSSDLKILTMERNNFIGLISGNPLKHLLHSIEFKIIYKGAYKVIVNSEGLKKQFQRFVKDKEKVTCIGNPFDYERVDFLSKKQDLNLNLKEKKFIDSKFILTVGRLCKQKDQAFLINNFQEIIEKINPEIKLIILGDGELKFFLGNLIKKFNLDESILIIDYLENPYPLIKKCELLALTSDWEGMPNVLIEAAYLEKKIISSDCDFGPNEIKKYANMTLFKKNDVFDFYEKLNNLLNIKDLDTSGQKEYIKKNFNSNHIASKYMNLIKRGS